MKMICKAFAAKLFGTDDKRLARTLFLDLIVFWGLYSSGFRVRITPSVLYLTVSAFTAGAMRLALLSEDNISSMGNFLMLPLDSRAFVSAYVVSLGAYTLFTKTFLLLAVLFAVSAPAPAEIAGCALCAVHAVLLAAAAYSLKKHRYAGRLWTICAVVSVSALGNKPWFLLLPALSGALAFLLLYRADGYRFYSQKEKDSLPHKVHGRHSVCRYLFRYMKCRRNYLANTAILWGAACVLPLFFGQTGSLSAAPLGFALLSLNTPVCILLSCDPALEQAVRSLPGQAKSFCLPYCLFIFFCNMTADIIFLCSMRLLYGAVSGFMIAAAAFFALFSAVCSVALEWFFPIRGWKNESDLWHHPRKYIVPAVTLLLAAALLQNT